MKSVFFILVLSTTLSLQAFAGGGGGANGGGIARSGGEESSTLDREIEARGGGSIGRTANK